MVESEKINAIVVALWTVYIYIIYCAALHSRFIVIMCMYIRFHCALGISIIMSYVEINTATSLLRPEKFIYEQQRAASIRL